MAKDNIDRWLEANTDMFAPATKKEQQEIKEHSRNYEPGKHIIVGMAWTRK